MITPTITCTDRDHAEYRKSDGSCRVCTDVASWPPPTPEQVEVLRRCLPPLSPEQLAEIRGIARTSSASSRRAA